MIIIIIIILIDKLYPDTISTASNLIPSGIIMIN